jgi:hypothetical protein
VCTWQQSEKEIALRSITHELQEGAMKITRIVCGAAIMITAAACAHNQQESTASSDSRIKPSRDSTARDTSSEYGNQGTRMGSPTDSSRREQPKNPPTR